MYERMHEMTEKLMSDIQAKQENLIKQKLIEKGYPELANLDETIRFPKLNRTICDGWTYIFAENGTKQGDFIVAIGPLEYESNFDFSKVHSTEPTASSNTTITFKFQDKDFSKVAIRN